MLNQLLESKKSRKRSPAGTFFSVILHSVLIFLAVVATARASGRTIEKPKAEKINFIAVKKAEPPAEKKPEPPKPKPASPKVQQPKVVNLPQLPKEVPVAPPQGFKVLTAPVSVPVTIPNIDITAKVADASDFSGRGVAGGTASGVAGGTGDATSKGSLAGVDSHHVFTEDEVETPAQKIGGESPPYPESLRSSGIEGEVVVQFVVNENGRYESGSLKVLRSSNPAFTAAVKEALPNMRFAAARVGGRKVKQLVEQPFEFHLNR